MKLDEPSFGLAVAMSLVPLAAVGIFAGIGVRDASDAAVTT